MATGQKRTIVIVGGVAGGASAAARARRCNEEAEIILYEKDEHVSFANCGLPYHIGDEIEDRSKLLVATPELFEKRFRIQVRTFHEVLSIDRGAQTVKVKNVQTGEEFEQNYDRLILSPGASPIVPPIEELKGPDAARNVMTLRNMEDMDRIKNWITQNHPRKAVVVGAGFIGLEMVEQLHRIGMMVSLVELAPQVLPPLDPEMAKLVERELHRHDIDLHLGNGIQGLEVENGLATHVRLDQGESLPADLVILGIGVRPNTALATGANLIIGKTGGIYVNEFMQTNDPLIYAVGDVAEYKHGVLNSSMRIPLAGPANKAGRIAGTHAATDQAPSMPNAYGTAIVRVFELSAGLTGLSAGFANRFDQTVKEVIIQAGHHAGYFPGSQNLTLKLLYDPDTGKVMGAQAVGGEGVDKRIDVIATALQMGATVEDLTGLDLSYAPPFGSAKDPLHMAAFAAQNDLNGFVPVLPHDAELDGYQVVDVRNPPEWEKLPPVSNAILIPLDELRDQLEQLDPQKPTVTICHSAKRAHVAARILIGKGFKQVYNLTGGMSIRSLTQSSTVTQSSAVTGSSVATEKQN